MKPHRMSRWARLVAIVALVPTLAWAQGGPGERIATIDPSRPGDRGAGTDMLSWDVMQVNGLGSASTLGTLWVHTRRTRSCGPRGPSEGRSGTQPGPIVIARGSELPAGRRSPGGRHLQQLAPALRRNELVARLELKRETAGTLSPSARRHVRRDRPPRTVGPGVALRRQSLARGSLPTASPARSAISAGTTTTLSPCRGQDPPRRGPPLVRRLQESAARPGARHRVPGRDQIIAPGLNGSAVWDGRPGSGASRRWGGRPDVHGAWGNRDAAGELHMFVTGHGHARERHVHRSWSRRAGQPQRLVPRVPRRRRRPIR